MMTIRVAFAALLLSSTALAQTPGIGETRPGVPGSRDATGPAVDVAKPQADSDRAIARCNELSSTLRDDCLRQERAASAGATRPSEPATAPPPQNPR